MAGPDIALGLVGAIDVAIRCGTVLVRTCSTFKHADDEIHERVVRVELCWKQTGIQLDFLRSIREELDVQHQRLQEEILTILATKLSAVESRLRSFGENEDPFVGTNVHAGRIKTRRKARAAYALSKEHLDRALDDMEWWQKRFDPSWFLILRVPSEHIDRELRSAASRDTSMKTAFRIRDSLDNSPKREVSVNLPEAELESAAVEEVSLSTINMMYRAKSAESFILDTAPCASTASFPERMKAIRDLARKLTNADPSKFALLKCAGFVPRQALNQLTLVFRLPDGTSDPQSLRALLISEKRDHSLSDRFRLATQLATAVCSVHTFGFVHKNIRPENVLMLRDQHSTIGSGFLLGFEHVRLEEGRTERIGDTDWEKNIYRHPQRQGARLEDSYVMQHDIYSLGVCLLEIGLWTSFVRYPNGFCMPMSVDKYRFGLEFQTEEGKAEAVKSELLALAVNSLPSHMGSKYAKVVQTCLTCLDEACDDFGDEADFLDEDGVLVAVRYMEKVLFQLSSITV